LRRWRLWFLALVVFGAYDSYPKKKLSEKTIRIRKKKKRSSFILQIIAACSLTNLHSAAT